MRCHDWGTVVAADAKAEWLLSWWWNHYSKHQSQPVAFVDFGMSDKAKKWCKERGTLLLLQMQDFVASKEQLSKISQLKWEQQYGPSVWAARKCWFKKPLAMQLSPFERTVWMDLDCEVCQPIDAIWEGFHKGQLGAVRVERKEHYNSGVIIFDKYSEMLRLWAFRCLQDHHRYIGDENILNELIQTHRAFFRRLDRCYNWTMGWGYHPQIKIAHWVASWGKLCIETLGGIQAFSEKMLSDTVNRDR